MKNYLSMQNFSSYRQELMGFSAVWIALMHSFNQLFPSLKLPIVSKVFSYGNLGVEIFLILSGLGLYFSYSKNPAPIAFYQKRMKRILLPWLVLSLPYWIIVSIVKNANVGSFILNYTGLSFWLKGTTTVWYVLFIIPMYFIYPLIFKIQNKNPMSILYLLAFSLLLVGGLAKFLPVFYKKTEIALTRFPVFLIGSHIGMLLMKNKKADWIFFSYLIVSVIVFAAFEIVRAHQGKFVTILYRLGGGGLMIVLATLLCIFLLRFKVKLINQTLSIIGKCSLEFYLLNVFIRNLTSMFKIGQNSSGYVKAMVASAVFLVSLLLAYLFQALHSKLQKRLQMEVNQ